MSDYRLDAETYSGMVSDYRKLLDGQKCPKGRMTEQGQMILEIGLAFFAYPVLAPVGDCQVLFLLQQLALHTGASLPRRAAQFAALMGEASVDAVDNALLIGEFVTDFHPMRITWRLN